MLPALCAVLAVHLRQDLVELRWYGRGEVKRIGGDEVIFFHAVTTNVGTLPFADRKS